MGASFWSPLLIAVASLASTVYLTNTNGLSVGSVAAAAVTVIALIAAYLAARTGMQRKRGGRAQAIGSDSEAFGGDAGKGEFGGDGGDAIASGRRSKARGGKGGD